MIALDTNILIYAIGNCEKRTQAIAVIARCATSDCVIPIQVLAEFANVCRRKTRLNSAMISQRIGAFSDVFATPATAIHHIQVGATLADRYRLSFFDALICAVVRDAGATTLLSEDMQDGLRIGDLEILNPLLTENEDRLNRALSH